MTHTKPAILTAILIAVNFIQSAHGLTLPQSGDNPAQPAPLTETTAQPGGEPTQPAPPTETVAQPGGEPTQLAPPAETVTQSSGEPTQPAPPAETAAQSSSEPAQAAPPTETVAQPSGEPAPTAPQTETAAEPAPPPHQKEITLQPGDDLQAALDAAQPGDHITLAPGTWQGNYTINIPITLSGSKNGDTILDGGGKGKVLHLKAPDSTIEHLTVRHSGNSQFDMDSGIFADRKAARAHIHHNRAENNLFGLYIWGPENALVEHNTVIGQNEGRVNDRGNAIQIWKSPHTIIRDNTLSGGRDGIYVTNSKYNLFENNTMRNMRFGVHYMYTEDSEVAHNHTENLESAYVIMFSNRITVRDNSGQDSREHGLMLNAVNDAKIHGNHIERANKCVFLYNANRNAFHDNHFENCILGIHSTAGSTDNQNYRNSFIDNQTQVMYVGTRYHEWSHDGQGNYWSDNSAFDLNGDGIADLPYRPNNILDQVLWRAPNAKILINSPAAQLLKYAQQQFPAIHPGGVVDSYPLMNPPTVAP
ncbi:nitrous oxide reductase family maturation protein NosD [Cardiobacterium hominis]|uniref:nitrous oxide reductase family maturation protein NosD n=1 Tax=Cardiobacterium hominis TaxID=2718 RepID=UPI0028D82186|nr:nitrous oxide reductase family maturation protein NosD [Cardiobacterium hominis]